MKLPLLILLSELCFLTSTSFAASPSKLLRVEGGIVQFGDEVVVSTGTSVNGSVVVMSSSAQVLGPVDEDVVVIGGPLFIDSVVGGSVFAVGRTVTLGPKAVIGGDLTTIGARLIESSGSVVKGQKVTLSGLKMGIFGALAALAAFFAAIVFWLKVFASVGWAILAVLLAVLFPGALEDSSEYLTERPWWSLAGGLLTLPAALLISAALLVSILGIALLPLLGIALAALGVWGYLTVGFWVGDRIFRGFRMYMQGWLACLLGIMVIQLLRWIPGVGNLVMTVALVFGIGAALMTFLNACMRWRMRPVHVA